MGTLRRDLRYGLRVLAKSPGFTAVAVLTLALGIGVNTAIFSVVKAVLLHSLPFKDPNRLVYMRNTIAGEGSNPVSYPDYLDWRAQSHSFSEMAAFTDAEFILSGNEQSERIFGEQVTGSYFSLLGVAAIKGRTFLLEENETPMAHAVAVISYGLWQRRFGSDPDIIGKQVRLNNADFAIVGVAPRGFHGFSDTAEVWIPVMMHDALWPQTARFDFVHARDVHWMTALAALAPGVSLEQARAEMATIGVQLAKAYSNEDKDRGVAIQFAKEAFTGSFRAPLLVLLAAVGFVLLIACANVVNLLLTRLASREREMAIRLALGAGRGRLLRQFLTEALLLSAAGALTGFLLAAWGLDLLVSILPLSFPSFARIRLDGGVLAFTSLLMLGTAVLLGVLPAFGAGRENLQDALKEGAKGMAGRPGQRLRGLLVVSEVALALLLLAGAGLLLKSLGRLVEANSGFRPDHLLTMRFYVPDRKYDSDGRNRFGPELAQRIAALSGVESAAVTFIDPFKWGGFSRGFTLEGHAPISTADQDATIYQESGPGYFQTMGVPILAGRDFTMRDALDAPRVVIVSESFARRFWPGQNPIGKRIHYGPLDSKSPWMQVVGEVGNLKFNSLRDDMQAERVFYGPLLQSEVIMNMSLIVRTRPAPESMIPALRDAIQKIDSDIPVYNVATLDERMREDSAETRSYAMLLAFFAGLAVTLAAVGIYGVMAFTVEQRTREIGIRMALGAQPQGVLRMVVSDGLRLAGLGLAAGLAGAFALTRLMAGLLYGVGAKDPATFAAVALLLAGVALVACWIPARRAMRVDPIVALRYE